MGRDDDAGNGPPESVASSAGDAARREDTQSRPALDGSRSPPASRRELLDHARAYARSLDVDVDFDAIEWEISERAKRRAGACHYDATTETVTIRLTWRAYEEHGWSEMRGTIRHELVHAWEFQHLGEAGHGPEFRAMADEIDAPRYCREFSEPRLRLVCRTDGCDWSADRHRASKTVTRPERRRCGSCGGEYEVRHLESGETWTSYEGYRRARDRLGEEW